MDNNKPQNTNFSLPQPISEPPAPPAQTTGPLPAEQEAPKTPPAMPKGDASDSLSPEWVRSIEMLSRQYMDDPRKFSDELSKLKARYIKERYNKDIKTSENKGH